MAWHGGAGGHPRGRREAAAREFVKATRSPEILRIIEPQATDVFVATPDEFGKRIAADLLRLGQVIRDAGIKAQ